MYKTQARGGREEAPGGGGPAEAYERAAQDHA